MNNDYGILRNLALEKKALVENYDNESKIKLWRDVNDLKATRPPVIIFQVPWSEFSSLEEMNEKCKDEFLINIERKLRRDIYQMKHFPADMVYFNKIECPPVVYETDFLPDRIVDIIPSGQINSQHFTPILTKMEDVGMIKEAIVEYDRDTTEKRLDLLHDIFGGICDIELTGKKGHWFTPWDYLISRTGVTEAMIDLIERPDFVNAYVSKFVDVNIKYMERYEELGLWGSNNNDAIVGSGGYGYTSDLAEAPSPNIGTDLMQMWGCGNAQIFSEVSPDMHWEFSLRHEMRWLERFGMNYYGCCEQLHHKIDILSRIPGLRKISMSPWANLDVAREAIDRQYVMSIKPTPSSVAMEPFDEDVIRKEINSHLDKTDGNPTEFVLKDISTVKCESERLDAWDRIVREEIDRRFS